jgi:hypothetical protein
MQEFTYPLAATMPALRRPNGPGTAPPARPLRHGGARDAGDATRRAARTA